MSMVQRDQKIKLSDVLPDLNVLKVGLGWKVDESGENFDLDASAFMLDHNNEVRNKKDFVFYNNLSDISGALQHSGDNLTGGDGKEDSEQITVNMKAVPQEIAHITFVVTIFDALERQQTFGRVNDAYIRVVDAKTNKEIIRYNLEKEFYSATSVVIADIAKFNNEWYFDAVGVPFSGGLEAIANDFDLNLAK